MSMSEQESQGSIPTREELIANKMAIIKQMKSEIPNLKVEAEYYGLITQIEQDRHTRMMIQMQMAQLLNSQKEAKKEPTKEEIQD